MFVGHRMFPKQCCGGFNLPLACVLAVANHTTSPEEVGYLVQCQNITNEIQVTQSSLWTLILATPDQWGTQLSAVANSLLHCGDPWVAEDTLRFIPQSYSKESLSVKTSHLDCFVWVSPLNCINIYITWDFGLISRKFTRMWGPFDLQTKVPYKTS